VPRGPGQSRGSSPSRRSNTNSVHRAPHNRSAGCRAGRTVRGDNPRNTTVTHSNTTSNAVNHNVDSSADLSKDYSGSSADLAEDNSRS
jgi:hypothetical protein